MLLNCFCCTWNCSDIDNHLGIPHEKNTPSMFPSFERIFSLLDYCRLCIYHYVVYVYWLFGRDMLSYVSWQGQAMILSWLYGMEIWLDLNKININHISIKIKEGLMITLFIWKILYCYIVSVNDRDRKDIQINTPVPIMRPQLILKPDIIATYLIVPVDGTTNNPHYLSDDEG